MTQTNLFLLFWLRSSPRLLCTATQQKNGPGSEEEAEKPDQNAAEKVTLEEKSQLETQLKDMTVSFERKGVTTPAEDGAESAFTNVLGHHFHQ